MNAVTNGISISVNVRYLPSQSNAFEFHYFFQYTISIHNTNDFSVQLQRRKWNIFDSNGEKKEVEGEGVVGETPVIGPDQTYVYSSGCNLCTDWGRMDGFYTLCSLLDNRNFLATIPSFVLTAPWKFN